MTALKAMHTNIFSLFLKNHPLIEKYIKGNDRWYELPGFEEKANRGFMLTQKFGDDVDPLDLVHVRSVGDFDYKGQGDLIIYCRKGEEEEVMNFMEKFCIFRNPDKK